VLVVHVGTLFQSDFSLSDLVGILSQNERPFPECAAELNDGQIMEILVTEYFPCEESASISNDETDYMIGSF
jgi:hypothetical protein